MSLGRHLAQDLTPPGPLWILIANACTQASLSAALAPLFGNDPNNMGATGFDYAMLISLPVYACYLIGRRRR